MTSMTIDSASAKNINIVSVKNIAHWDYLNIRSEASASSDVVGKIPSGGDNVVLLGEEQKNGKTLWVKIAFGTVKGWVNASYLNFFTTETVAWEEYKATIETKKDIPVKSKKEAEIYGTAEEFRAKISEYRVEERIRREYAEKEATKAKEAKVHQELAKKHEAHTHTIVEEKLKPKSKSQPKSSDIVLKCGGIKPFWNVDLTQDDIQVNIDKERNALPITSRRKSSFYAKSVIVQGYNNSEDNAIKLYLSKDNICKDGITNLHYPYSVKAVLNGNKVYYGCCDSVQ
jgi:uncharacterized membrane protein